VTPFWQAPHASWPWASAPWSYGPSLRAHRSQLRMLFSRRHRIRDALRGRKLFHLWHSLVGALSSQSRSWSQISSIKILEHTSKRASLLCQTAWRFGKGPGVSWGRFPLLNLVGRRKTHLTSLSNVCREFWLCFQCRSRGSLWSEYNRFGYELRFYFLNEKLRNIEHFLAREQWA